jgi:uncharacterized delta-60 repeat protein
MKHSIILIVLILFASQLAHAQASFFDETFGYNGVVTTEVPEEEGFGIDCILLPDGKILQTARVGDSYSSDAVIYRREHNGKIDSSFGTDGRVLFPCDCHMFDLRLATYPDGRILVHGAEFYGSPGYVSYLYRLLPSGTIDSSFGTNGRQYISDSSMSQIHQLELTTDDKIFAVGEEGSYINNYAVTQPVLWQLTPNGKRDSTFGTNGKIFIPLGGDSKIVIGACKDSNNGFIFMYKKVYQDVNTIHIFRTHGDGSVDSTYGSAGLLSLLLTDSFYETPLPMTLPDGSMVYAMNFGVSSRLRTALIKVTREGFLDTEFGSYGSVELASGAEYAYSSSLALDSSGRIVVTGRLSNDSGTSSSSVFRVFTNGVIDSSFGLNGALHLIDDHSGYAATLHVQPDGKYLIAGGSQSKEWGYYTILMARLNPDAKVSVKSNSSLGTGISVYPTPSTDNCTVTYTLPSSGECRVTLRDESGREVRTFASEYRTAGEHKEELDLRGLAAGVYFLQIESGGVAQTAKLIKQ